MGKPDLRLGTRGSALALAQARAVAAILEGWLPGLLVEVVTVVTTGDRDARTALSRIGGTGLFTKELEEALLRGEIDAAVHSLKDLPGELPAGLVLAAVPAREDARDAFISGVPGARHPGELPPGAVIGVGSRRRVAQIKARWPSAETRDIRGNVDTRLRKVSDGEVAATVLACAGLRRLSLESRVTRPFDLDEMVPAPGQGALGLECRADAARVFEILRAAHDPLAAACVSVERAVMSLVGGGCSIPLGVHVEPVAGGNGAAGELRARAFLGDPGGYQAARVVERMPAAEGRVLALRVHDRLRDLGADAILARLAAEGEP